MTLRRLGEPPTSNCPSLPSPAESSTRDTATAISQYTAPPIQDMHATDCPTVSAATAQPEQDQATDGQAQSENDPSPRSPTPCPGCADPSIKHISLGKQLGDALKLRNWKPNRPSQQSSQQPDSALTAGQASCRPHASLSPRTESAMMLAASELGFDNQENDSCRLNFKLAKPELLQDATAARSVHAASVYVSCVVDMGRIGWICRGSDLSLRLLS